MASDSKLLKEIRDTYQLEVDNWREIRDEAAKDMRFVAGQPWDQRDLDERRSAGRLSLTFDQINQYCNQLINDVRQNKRAVKVLPKGLGANDQTAELRGGIIRQIEYDSKAQPAYRTAFEGVVQRSYGAWMYKTQYVSDSSFDHEIKIVRVPNPDVIYMDWEAREADFSDASHAFEIDSITREKFERDWPDAEVQSFTTEHMREYPQWIKNDKMIQIAKYWKVNKTKDKLFLFANNSTASLSELEEQYGKVKVKGNYLQFDSKVLQFDNWRPTETCQITQYITNGLEILEENDWPGKYIPIVFITGKEIYVDEGHGPKRKLLSLVRLARDPYMAYCYLSTSQIEMAQMMPKVPLMGYEGQFNTNTKWDELHKTITAYAEFKATTPESTAANRQQILPPPTRPTYAFDVQSLEIVKESCLRAIQSAMGITGLLNGTNPNAEAKSGVALRTMDQQESQGNFHFIDNYDMGVEYGGRIMDDLLGPVYDSEDREVGVRNLRGEHSVARINQFAKGANGEYMLHPETQEKQRLGFHTDIGEHSVTISTGPSFESQRAEGQDFAESLTKMGDPIVLRSILPDIVRLRNLGPIGDEIAKKLDALDPTKQQVPPQVQQQIQKLTGLVQRLMQERQAKTVELQGKAFIASQQQQVDLEKKRYDIIGEITAMLVKAGVETNAAAYAGQLEHLNMLWEQMHEFNMQTEAFNQQAAQAQAAQAATAQQGQPQPPQSAGPTVQQPLA